MEQSTALQTMDQDLVLEYSGILARLRDELSTVVGAAGVHDVLMERFAFTYVLMRSYERKWGDDDFHLGRYNVLGGLWLKVATDLINSYKDLFSKSVVEDVFVEKVLTIVGEEVDDPDTLAKIRARFASEVTD